MYSPAMAAQPGANPGFPVNAVAPSVLLSYRTFSQAWAFHPNFTGPFPVNGLRFPKVTGAKPGVAVVFGLASARASTIRS